MIRVEIQRSYSSRLGLATTATTIMIEDLQAGLPGATVKQVKCHRRPDLHQRSQCRHTIVLAHQPLPCSQHLRDLVAHHLVASIPLAIFLGLQPRGVAVVYPIVGQLRDLPATSIQIHRLMVDPGEVGMEEAIMAGEATTAVTVGNLALGEDLGTAHFRFDQTTVLAPHTHRQNGSTQLNNICQQKSR